MKRATIQRRYDFEAAHRLPHVPDGHKCKNMHGHSYQVVVQVTGPIQESGPETGMVVDFGVLDSIAAHMKSGVDHTTLNETVDDNPTIERMVLTFWGFFSAPLSARWGNPSSLAKPKKWILKVWLCEGPRSCAVYPPEET